jgi:hypothetical protein
MYVEQLLRDCEACNRPFAVQYEFGAPRLPSTSSDRVHVRVVRCPSCRHLNPLIMLMYVHHVVVKPAPGLEPTDVRPRPRRNLIVAATSLLSRLRPFLP